MIVARTASHVASRVPQARVSAKVARRAVSVSVTPPEWPFTRWPLALHRRSVVVE